MRVSYSPDYFVPLPEGHPFPMAKFPALHEQLIDRGLLRPEEVVEPRPADWHDLLSVHTPDYLQRLDRGQLTKKEVRRMGLPWSRRLVHRSRVAVQGTKNAALMALEDGMAANLAGGTHHAFPGHGEGFCVLNDVAVAIRTLFRSMWIGRALVVDCDVHQGNGTAAIFASDERVYTYSIHGAKNYPFEKPPSSMDVGLEDGTEDDRYMERLRETLPEAIDRAGADIAFYLAGIDVAAGDRYGRLNMTPEGIERRDGYVLEALRSAGLPVVLLLSGGYAKTPARTAELHARAHVAARSVRRRSSAA